MTILHSSLEALFEKGATLALLEGLALVGVFKDMLLDDIGVERPLRKILFANNTAIGMQKPMTAPCKRELVECCIISLVYTECPRV